MSIYTWAAFHQLSSLRIDQHHHKFNNMSHSQETQLASTPTGSSTDRPSSPSLTELFYPKTIEIPVIYYNADDTMEVASSKWQTFWDIVVQNPDWKDMGYNVTFTKATLEARLTHPNCASSEEAEAKTQETVGFFILMGFCKQYEQTSDEAVALEWNWPTPEKLEENIPDLVGIGQPGFWYRTISGLSIWSILRKGIWIRPEEETDTAKETETGTDVKSED